MLKNRKLVIAAIVGLTLGISSCKKFMDVNTNPNVSKTATLKILLPTAELYVASGMGVDLQVYGAFFAQHWTQSPASNYYRSVDQYTPSQDFFNNSWTNLYAANENFYQLQNLADSQYSRQYEVIALLMQAYTFQAITDAWGDAPFAQALKGQYLNGHYVSPKYDSQKVIYKGILTYIDSALKIVNANDATLPGTDDLIYQGDMNKWRKFGLTLKLRTILRMSLIDPVTAQADLVNLYNTPNLAFIGTGDDAAIKFGYNAGNNNPLYAEQVGIGTQNIAASATCLDSMMNNYDTLRMKVFYEAGSNGAFSGIKQGDYYTSATSYSIPNIYVAGDVKNTASGNAQVNLLTSYESLFLQAEAVARGWVVPGPSDATYFYQAIQANFNYYNTQLTSATGYSGTMAYNTYIASGGSATNYPIGGSVNQKLRYIILQKWYAMCGNESFEAWTELRRTGLDSILTPSVNSAIGAQLPKRFLYPTAESNNNANFPGLKPITTKVWWDLY